jgi:hypothetical protein
MSAKSEWTPYGLEAIRIAHLRRRRILGILLLLGVGALLLLLLDTTTTSQLDISVNGRSGNGISLDLPDEQPRDGPVTVSLSPGKVTRAEAGSAAPESTVTRSNAPSFQRAPAYDFGNLALLALPWVLLGLAVWFLAARRGRHDEVNYGIYKGSMPLEMITASASRQVFTRRHARHSLFGRRRADHLPPEAIHVEPAAEETRP